MERLNAVATETHVDMLSPSRTSTARGPETAFWEISPLISASRNRSPAMPFAPRISLKSQTTSCSSGQSSVALPRNPI